MHSELLVIMGVSQHCLHSWPHEPEKRILSIQATHCPRDGVAGSLIHTSLATPNTVEALVYIQSVQAALVRSSVVVDYAG